MAAMMYNRLACSLKITTSVYHMDSYGIRDSHSQAPPNLVLK